MTSLMQDLRYAVRMMTNNRAFTAMSVIVLALGIAANTLIFSVVNTVLIRPLPYPDPDRIVKVFESDLKRHTPEAIAAANFLDWRDQNQVFENMATYRSETLERANPGFETRNVLTMRLSLPAAQYAEPKKRAIFFQGVIERLQSGPGVESAGAISRLPMTPGNRGGA